MWWSWPQSGVWWWLQSGILVMAGCFQTIRKDLAHPQERRCQSDYARLQSVIISLLITFHSDWRYGCYDCCDSGDAENQHSLFDIELIATVSFDYVDWMAKSKKKKVFDSELNVIVFLWLCWLDDDVKNESTLSNCEVIAPGRGNIRPSSKNSPQFKQSFTINPL